MVYENQDSSPLIVWRVIAARRWMIALVVLLSVTVTAVLVLREPRLYEAEVEMMALSPAWQNSEGDLIAPVLAGLGHPFRPIKLALREPIYWELYARVLAEALAEEWGLQAHYGTKTKVQTLEALEAHRSIQLTSQGHFRVKVVDRDPEMAVTIANAHARHLDLLDRRLLAEAAAVRRRVLETRVREAEDGLAKLEMAWTPLAFRVAAAGGEGEGLAGEAARGSGERASEGGEEEEEEEGALLSRFTTLKLRALDFEVDRARIRTFTREAHPWGTQLDARLMALRRTIDRLEGGQRGGKAGAGDGSFIPSLTELTQLALPSQRLGRETKLRGQYYLLWRQALEDVRVEEALDLPRVWVLDPAIPQERPRRLWQKSVVAGVFALVLGVLLSFVLSYVDRLRQIADRASAGRF